MWRVAPALIWYLVSLVSAWIIGARGPVYWDSFGYVAQAVTGHVGGLGVGRPVFALATQGIADVWVWAGGSVWDLERVLRLVCVLVSACAAPLSRRLALESGFTDRAATLVAACVACSPAFAHSSATVLTDGPATTCVLLTWIVALRAARDGRVRTAALAGVWFGVAVGVREASVYAGVALLGIGWCVAPRVRVTQAVVFCLVTAVVVALPMAWVYATQPGYVDTIAGWLAGLEHDAALKAWDLREAALIGWWLVLFGPLPLVLTMAWLRHWAQAGSWRYTLVVPAWLQWAVMMSYMGIAYSPRYLMTAFPAAMAMPAAWLLDRWIGERMSGRARAAMVIALLVPLLGGRLILQRTESVLLGVSSTMAIDLARVPSDAVVVTGHACPAIPMIRHLAAVEPRPGLGAPAWTEICPGWGWPDDIADTLNAHIDAGRVVVLDLRDAAWQGPEQLASRDTLRQFAAAYDQRRPGAVITWEAARADRVQ